MRAAVIGGGDSGRAIVRALTDRGVQARCYSRTTGFDVLRDDASQVLDGAGVIIEATGCPAMTKGLATAFFTRSTRALARAAGALGARHVLLSIVNCDNKDVGGYGYYAGKAAQEHLARVHSPRLTIVRSTQWFEFARQTQERLRLGPVCPVPSMSLQPVALEAVATAIAEAALTAEDGAVREVAGPEVMTLREMVRQDPIPGCRHVSLPIPTSWGRAMRRGGLLPGPGVEIVGPTFDQWLSSGPHEGRGGN